MQKKLRLLSVATLETIIFANGDSSPQIDGLNWLPVFFGIITVYLNLMSVQRSPLYPVIYLRTLLVFFARIDFECFPFTILQNKTPLVLHQR